MFRIRINIEIYINVGTDMSEKISCRTIITENIEIEILIIFFFATKYIKQSRIG